MDIAPIESSNHTDSYTIEFAKWRLEEVVHPPDLDADVAAAERELCIISNSTGHKISCTGTKIDLPIDETDPTELWKFHVTTGELCFLTTAPLLQGQPQQRLSYNTHARGCLCMSGNWTSKEVC